VNFDDSEGWHDSKPPDKMPPIDLSFWCVLVLAAAVGSALTALLTDSLGIGRTTAAVILGVLAFNVLVVQVRAIVHIPAVFWAATAAISALATLAQTTTVPKLALAQHHIVALAALALAATLASWHTNESLPPRQTRLVAQREVYYWLSTLLAFMLGAALFALVLQMVAPSLTAAVLIFAAGFLVMLLVHMAVPALALPAFWLACACAWSFGGATVQLLAHPATDGGLGFGTVPTSALFVAAMAAMVVRAAQARDEQLYVSNF
jgi:uncharacterized membrane-anchored protein